MIGICNNLGSTVGIKFVKALSFLTQAFLSKDRKKTLGEVHVSSIVNEFYCRWAVTGLPAFLFAKIAENQV